MLKIREAQMQAFEANARILFEQRAIRHLRTHLPEQTSAFGDDDLRARIRTGADGAREYGLESEQQIMCFVDSGFLLTPRFDSDNAYPWAREILRNPELSPNERAGTLLATAERVSGYRKPDGAQAGNG